jgi:hypothetical protein
VKSANGMRKVEEDIVPKESWGSGLLLLRVFIVLRFHVNNRASLSKEAGQGEAERAEVCAHRCRRMYGDHERRGIGLQHGRQQQLRPWFQ